MATAVTVDELSDESSSLSLAACTWWTMSPRLAIGTATW
jgi:hypothetical protein